MRRLWIPLLALALLLPAAASAQQIPPQVGNWSTFPSNQMFMKDVYVLGTLYKGTPQTDWVEWFPASISCSADYSGATTLIPRRLAASDWALGRVAAGAETYNIACFAKVPTRLATQAGASLKSIIVAYNIPSGNLTNATFTGVSSVLYAAGTTNAVAVPSGGVATPTLATTASANTYFAYATFNTPVYQNTEFVSVVAEFTAVMVNNGQFNVLGLGLRYTRND